MISLFTKTTKRVDIVNNIRKHLFDNYDREDVQVVEDEVNKAQAYRDELLAAMQNQVTTSELLDRHKQYYAQLELLSKVLSFGKAKGQVTVDFTWTDSFRVNKRSSSKSIDFEKNSLLFNIAALHCKFALEKNRKTELGLKDAMKNLIQSASIFAYLIDKTRSVPVEEKTMDMSQGCLQVAALLMQAQAQTCYFEGAQMKELSIELISRLAIAASDVYGKALAKVEGDPALKNWVRKCEYPYAAHIGSQRDLFRATALFWCSKAALSERKYGEEITWLKTAKELTDQLKPKGLHANLSGTITEFKSLIETEHERSVKDNNSIYHSRVPEKNTLIYPEPQLLAEVNEVDLSKLRVEDENEILSKIYPVEVTRLSRKIRSDLLTDVDQLNGNNLTNNQRHLSVLKEYSHFLPDVDSPDTYGHVIDQHKPLFIDVKRISEIRGVGFLQNSLKKLSDSHEEASGMLKTIQLALEEEKKRDEFNRTRYSLNWTLMPSIKAASDYNKEVKDIVGFLEDADKSNSKMRDRTEKISPSITFLVQQTPESIAKTLPNITEHFSESDTVRDIKETITLMQNLLKEKAEILDNYKKEIEKVNLSAMIVNKKGVSKFDDHLKIAEAIKQEFAEPVRQSMDRVETRLRAQHDSISRLGAEVKRLGRSDKEFVEKNGVLDKYKNAVKAFTSLEESLKAGATFYSDLRTFCLDVLMAKVSDYVERRNKETSAKIAEIENQMRVDNRAYFGDSMHMIDTRMQNLNVTPQQNAYASYNQYSAHTPYDPNPNRSYYYPPPSDGGSSNPPRYF